MKSSLSVYDFDVVRAARCRRARFFDLGHGAAW
jgi:hypothetical protein